MNRAAELGPSKFDWWKDWRGECVAIVASGPSTSREQVQLLRNRIHVVAIKQNVDLCPWADAVYGCDEPWWRSRRGLPEYEGLKLSYADKACSRYHGIKKIEITGKQNDRILLQDPGVIGSGGNSGFQALNIVIQFGVSGIILVGFDMDGKSKNPHWYGRNTASNMSNPNENNFRRWRAAFSNNAGQLAELGIDIVNASTISALNCFRRAPISEALKGWGL